MHARLSRFAPIVASSLALAALASLAGCGGNKGSSGSGGSTSQSGSTSSSAGGAGGAGSSTTTSTGSGAGGGFSKFPDTSSSIAVLADQLPDGMSAGQVSFAASHFVGSQKLTLDISGALRAQNPKFLVLHYHLAIWQSAPGVDFIVDGQHWSNDYPTVTTHESWFWHNESNQRVASNNDGKLLMNLADPGFAGYWQTSLEQQVADGQYDGIFFDSASPALLQGEAQSPPEPRLSGTGARDTPIAEWGNKMYIQVWQSWISALDTALAAKGIPLIPNTSAFVTSWDNTDYSLTAGIFSEGYASPSFAESDWKASTNELLSLAAKDKIIILQNYLGDPSDLATRRYYLANYLLVRGKHTYLDYFASGPLEWYPEWGLDLGAATTTGQKVDDLLQSGVYRRDFEKGVVLVNPSSSPVTVSLGATFQRVEPQGGGAVDAAGTPPGSIGTTAVSSIDVPANGAEILLK
jgi:hypothetical protein